VRKGRLTTGVLLWLVAAAAATAVGMTAVGAIGTDIFGAGNDPLSEAEVEAMLATETRTTSATPPSSAPPPTSQAPTPTEIPTVGGTVLARCAAGGVEIVSANPAQGYQADTDDREVTFSAGDLEIEVRLRCENDVVTHEIRQEED
jgi:hypothetical protein